MLKERDNIFSLEEMGNLANRLRAEGKSIATVNGSFDLMHAGHLHILKEGAKQADILIVGLNTDRSIQEYKSKKRPLIPLSYRLEMIAAIRYVDYATYFDETTPDLFLRIIRPDVHVNGAEYGADCVEAPTVREIGARLHLVNRIEGLSTTNIVDKILCGV